MAVFECTKCSEHCLLKVDDRRATEPDYCPYSGRKMDIIDHRPHYTGTGWECLDR